MVFAKRKGLIVFAVAALMAVTAGCQQEQTRNNTNSKQTEASKDSEGNPSELVVALLPDESASKVIQENQALKKYLEKELDKDIELNVSASYSSMIEAMVRGRLDLAYFGPLSYVLAKSKTNIEPFAVLKKDGATTYKSIMITHADSDIDSPADIAGQTMAYGDQASTSSHLIPKTILLEEEGLKAGEDYEQAFLGSHDAVARAVQNENADAGGMSKPIYKGLVERGSIDPEEVVVLKESDPYPQYPWTMRSDLDPELKQKIRDAYLKLDNPAVLKSFDADGFSPADDSDYDVVRNMTKVLNVDLENLN